MDALPAPPAPLCGYRGGQSGRLHLSHGHGPGGAILADVPPKTVFDPKCFYLVAVRQLLLPAVCLVALRLLGVDPLTAGVSVVLTGMPIGSTTAILAQKYGADAQFASKCVFISTLTSLVTVPILTLFL